MKYYSNIKCHLIASRAIFLVKHSNKEDIDLDIFSPNFIVMSESVVEGLTANVEFY